MSDTPLVVESDFEFPRVIVWDALVDSDLVSGWLAEATIAPEVGGEFTLRWAHRVGKPLTRGTISVFQPLECLEVDTADGAFSFVLGELAGGSRGTSTHLSVVLDGPADPVQATRVKADWLTNLDQLEDLLRGHPVDWANWDRDRHAAWVRHLGESQNSSA